MKLEKPTRTDTAIVETANKRHQHNFGSEHVVSPPGPWRKLKSKSLEHMQTSKPDHPAMGLQEDSGWGGTGTSVGRGERWSWKGEIG